MRPRLSAWPLALALVFSSLLLVPASPAAAADVPGLVPAGVSVDWPAQTITLTWGEPASPGAGPVTAFEVRLDSGVWTVLSPTTHTHTFTDVSLADHGVAVHARNALGAGPQTLVLVEKPVPSAPTAVSAEVVSGTAARLHWAPPAEDRGLPVTGYRVRTPACVTCPPDSGWRPLLPATQRSYEFTGLIAGARATFEVQALNAAGAGLPGYAEATPRGLPTAPTNVRAERSGAQLRDVKVDWALPIDPGGDAVPQVRLDDGAWIAVPEAGAGDAYPLTYTFPQQSPEAHTVAVRYVNSFGTGPEASAQAAGLAGSTPPRDLFHAIAPWGDVGVGWQPPATPGPGPMRYLVRLDGQTFGSTGLTGVWISGLAPGSSHVVTVVAVNGTGLESAPATIGFTVPGGPDPSPPSAAAPPAAPRVTDVAPGAVGGKRSARARWRPPAAVPGAPVTGYRVFARRIAPGGRLLATRRSKSLGPRQRSVSMTLPKGRWVFQVQARNRAGWSELSARSTPVRPR
ncbi:fibronectin type III domain-containing protein [Nocardioides sp. SYSU D00038]|uniref:fibronectin type III domain-containing protein n=1 Tax=Nocardioides sp. SYSU D00038 TaxID=2812554 RepID=UPI001967B57B|nr:fibronectin type III domain-containing protein [Nocardioides sp. SYSU D00038]